jgi:phosphoribosylformylglycinamidine cyclo-ligase
LPAFEKKAIFTSMTDPYASSGVDTAAGDKAVELMKKAVGATHGNLVLDGLGGFAGLIDAGFLRNYSHPVLATSTDGVGTKVLIAQAVDKHDTIGQDLVGMVVDDIVVSGAKSLFMTDYIACGKVVPTQIAKIVSGIARACQEVEVALVGGETAEHPGAMKEDEYDLAGAAVGVVEKSKILNRERVEVGDVVIALESSGLHANGYSLVRKIVAESKLDYRTKLSDFSRTLGEELLEPTRLYSKVLGRVIEEFPNDLAALCHITGGGIAANLSRVLPTTISLDIDRSTWSPPKVVSVLADIAKLKLSDLEGTWNMGIGFAAVVRNNSAAAITKKFEALGIGAWQVGMIESSACDDKGYITEAKGVRGGAVRLVGDYAD